MSDDNTSRRPLNSTPALDQTLAAVIGHEMGQRAASETLSIERQHAAFSLAMNQVDHIKEFVGNPSAILGSDQTKHGEIAEQVHVGIQRARAALSGVVGEKLNGVATFEGVGRLAPEDYLQNGTFVQSKYINGSNNSLRHVQEHLEKYPAFGGTGHGYHIPKDQYAQLEELRRTGQVLGEDGQRLTGRSLDALRAKIQDIELRTGRAFEDIVQPGEATYGEVQQGKIYETIDSRVDELNEEQAKLKQKITDEHAHSVAGAAGAAAMGAAAAGTLGVAQAVWSKHRDGKRLFQGEFDAQDWRDIGLTGAQGALKGGVTGAGLYVLTNCAELSAPLAGATVSCVTGIVSLYGQYRCGDIDAEEFIVLAQVSSLEVVFTSAGAVAGQALIPIPILGSLIGSVTARFVSSTIKRCIEDAEDDLIQELEARVQREASLLNAEALKAHDALISHLSGIDYLLELAFDENINLALRLDASIELARATGVPESQIIHNLDELDAFMME